MNTLRLLAHNPQSANTLEWWTELSASRAALCFAFVESRSQLVQLLRRYLRSQDDAQDAVHEAFLKLFQRVDTAEDRNVRALLFVTARNIARDKLRQRGRWISGGGDDVLAMALDEFTAPERTVAGLQQLELVGNLIEQLPHKCQRAFNDYHINGLEYAEIAVNLQLTESMVRKYVLRAVRHCASHLIE